MILVSVGTICFDLFDGLGSGMELVFNRVIGKNHQGLVMFTYSRRIAAIAVMLIVLSLAVAYYAEYWQGASPCPLCLLQRYLFMLLGVLFLLAWVTDPKYFLRITLGALLCVMSLAGAVLGSRQLFLQMQPPSSVETCLPGLRYLFQTMHWTEALGVVFSGSAECSMVHWKFLGMGMAFWSVCLFVLMAVFTILWAMRQPSEANDRSSR